MKIKISAFLLLSLLSLPVLLWSQAPRYALLHLHLDAAAYAEADARGLIPEHVQRTPGGLEAIYSAYDQQRLVDAGISFTVIAPDAEQYYAEQLSAPASVTKTAGTQQFATPAAFNLGTMGGYLTYDEMLLELDSMVMNYPTLITGPDTIGFTHENRPIRAYKISDNPAIDEGEPEVLYTGLHHAREPMSMVNLIFYMQYLLENQGTDPEATYLVANREMYFVPCINADGYVYNQTIQPNGGGLWRKNRRPTTNGEMGVDLNRNYGYEFGYDNNGSSPDPASDLYRGPSGFSEPETQAIRDYCLGREFRTSFNYHAFGDLLIHPWGYDASDPMPDLGKFTLYGQVLTAANGYFPGNATQTVGYDANGNSDDWMYGEQLTKEKIFSFTPEVGSGSFGFWPPVGQIEPYAEANVDANLKLAWLAGDYVFTTYEAAPYYPGPVAEVPTRFENLGLDTTGVFSASYVTTSPYVLSSNGPLTYSNLAPGVFVLDTFDLILDPNTPIGTEICGIIQTTMSSVIVREDTFCFRFGLPTVIFSDSIPTSPLSWNGGWGITSSYSYSPPNSMADSPNFNYSSNSNNLLLLNQPIDLSNFTSPQLQFRASWEIETNWDYCTLEISTDGTTYLPLAGQYTNPGVGSFQPNGIPLYDGFESDWVLENIDLSPFAGSQILLRWSMVSDGFIEYNGFFFDDLEVYGFPNNTVALDAETVAGWFLYPNPGQGTFRISGQTGADEVSLTITDLSGHTVRRIPGLPGQQIDLSDLAAGLYLYQFDESPIRKLMVE